MSTWWQRCSGARSFRLVVYCETLKALASGRRLATQLSRVRGSGVADRIGALEKLIDMPDDFDDDAVPNPPWVNRMLSANWAKLVARVGERRMPVETNDSTPRRRAVGEFGCGVYGCVIPTHEPLVVLKVTTDPFEAHFIGAAMSLGHWPDGIVRYHDIVRLPGRFRGRQAYAAWRDEAFEMGTLGRIIEAEKDHYEKRLYEEMRDTLRILKGVSDEFKKTYERMGVERVYAELAQMGPQADKMIGADQIDDMVMELRLRWGALPRSMFKALGYRGMQRLALLLRTCELVIERLRDNAKGYLVGEALGYYLDQGMLLADMHPGNVGQVERKDYSKRPWAIVDPGHALPLDARFDEVEVDVL